MHDQGYEDRAKRRLRAVKLWGEIWSAVTILSGMGTLGAVILLLIPSETKLPPWAYALIGASVVLLPASLFAHRALGRDLERYAPRRGFDDYGDPITVWPGEDGWSRPSDEIPVAHLDAPAVADVARERLWSERERL